MSEKKLSMAEILRKKREQRLKGQQSVSLTQAVEDLVTNSENIIHKIPINDLQSNPYQPRLQMDKEELNELVSSINKNGLMSPIIVADIEGKKVIVAGHRRTEACRILGWDKIPAIVRKDIDDNLLALLAITENTHRSNLNPIELAISYKNLLDNAFNSQKELAIALGVSDIKITRILNLLKLDSRIIDAVKNGKTKDVLALNMLNQIKDTNWQYQLFLKFLEKGREWLNGKIKEIKNNKTKNMENNNEPFIIKTNLKKGEIKIQVDKNKIPKEKINQFENELKSILEKYLDS